MHSQRLAQMGVEMLNLDVYQLRDLRMFAVLVAEAKRSMITIDVLHDTINAELAKKKDNNILRCKHCGSVLQYCNIEHIHYCNSCHWSPEV